ncbi:MAG: hypothetical protein KatS3mg030_758 [Saprospiraceae bacterium]|nr:MAG: hypothetical protein KatS3mg030_758 [Saprospiraceae bacterium]
MKKSFIPVVALSVVIGFALNAVFSVWLFQNLLQQQRTKPDLEGQTSTLQVSTSFRGMPVSLADAPPDFINTAKLATPAVVSISVRGRNSLGRLAGGSGVIVSSDGYIATNYHVVSDGGTVEVLLSNKKRYEARIIGKDLSTDLALLKINATGLPTIEFGDSDLLEVGEWVLAIGNPYDLTSTVTAGIVSAKARNINVLPSSYSIESFIQTDAVVNPGNSGGALVNLAGQLIGVNSAIMSESGGYEGYSFAIPSNLVRKVIEDLKTYGRVRRPILGVTILNVDDEIAQRYALPAVEGVLVREVAENSSAARAGLRTNDVIVAIDGKPARSVPELQELVARYRPGDRVSLQIFRNGRRLEIDQIELLEKAESDTFFQR